MKPLRKRLDSAILARAARAIVSQFGNDPLAQLFVEFLVETDYQEGLVVRLLDVAQGKAGHSWDVRRLATLMLENQLLNIPVDHPEAFHLVLARLGLISKPGIGARVNKSVLKEGFSTTELRGFVLELRQRLQRLNRIHDTLKGRISASAVREFIAASRLDCKLSLARYTFRPDEVVEQILKQIRTSRGLVDVDPCLPRYAQGEAKLARGQLPEYEAKIVEGLRRDSATFWVSERTSSIINSLVEYPLTTVVLVIKPPGSDIEFEIKRAGHRGAHPLSAVCWRDNFSVPPPHRLDGGSMQNYLRHEETAGSTLSIIYRLVHGSEAPVPRYIARNTIYDVPAAGGNRSIIDYFTDPRVFGEGFRGMRQAMKDSVREFKKETGLFVPTLPGDLGLTAHFLGHASPSQALLARSSSFRLDRVAQYLSPGGPALYFKEQLRVNYTAADARRLADEILEEILGVYTPPKVRADDYEEYVSDAFSVEVNRARAEEAYLSAMRELGRFWGTIVGIRGYANGECFVARNAGLKSVWEEGRWKAKLIFMDHDLLRWGAGTGKDFHAHSALSGMVTDEYYVVGRPGSKKSAAENQTHYLREIYRIDTSPAAEGIVLMRNSMKDAYQRTHAAIMKNPQVQKMFHAPFAARIDDWDFLVRSFLATQRGAGSLDEWRQKMRNYLSARKYEEGLAEEHLKAIEKYSALLERYSFLFCSA